MATKHITLSERIKIEYYLNQRIALSEIAQKIGRDRATIGREIKRHLVDKCTGNKFGHKFNDCQNRFHCHAVLSCGLGNGCTRKNCLDCKYGCGKRCINYEKETCDWLFQPPYVCNGCTLLSKCTLKKAFYEAHRADKEYHDDLSEFRSGFAIKNDEKEVIEQILRDGFISGHSLYSVMNTHANEFSYSIPTMYRYVNAGVFEGVGNMDMPRKPKYNGRRKKKLTRSENKHRHEQLIGRRKEDFDIHMTMNPESCVVQMDSVAAPRPEKRCLLTILFTDSSLQLAFLREHNDAISVVRILDHLKQKLGMLEYHRLFEVVLADNGSEFSNPMEMEVDPDTLDSVSKVFYCHPMASWEKGKCENNHALIRRILPKKHSFSELNQEKVTLMMNHINSYPRAQFGGKSAYDIFVIKHGKDAAEKLGLVKIRPEDVILRPDLLK